MMKYLIYFALLLFISTSLSAQIRPKSYVLGLGGFAGYDGGKKNFYSSSNWGMYGNAQYILNSHFSIGANFEYTRYNRQTDFKLSDTLWVRAIEQQKSRRFALFTRYYHDLGNPKWQGFLQGSVLFYNQFGHAVNKDTKEDLYALGGLVEVGFDLIPGVQFMPTPHWGIEATAGRLYIVSVLKGLNSYDHHGFGALPLRIGLNYVIF